MRDVTAPPPTSVSFLRMVVLIEVNISPYVVACPRSIACMNENVIAPVEVTLDKDCPYELVHYIRNINIFDSKSQMEMTVEI